MKIANDIKSLLEDDIKKLTEAMLSGEVGLADGRGLPDTGLTEGDVHQLAGEVVRFMLANNSLSAIMAALGSMKWQKLVEAQLYSRKSRNTLLSWIEDGSIYGTQEGPGGDWLIDRESLDRKLYRKRDERRVHLARAKGGRT